MNGWLISKKKVTNQSSLLVMLRSQSGTSNEPECLRLWIQNKYLNIVENDESLLASSDKPGDKPFIELIYYL